MSYLNKIEGAKYVTLPVNAGYQPTNLANQYQGLTGEFLAVPCRFAVRSGTGVIFHGEWQTLEEAISFADSMGSFSGASLYPRAVAFEVEQYFYAPAFGVV